ncbi:MAG: acetyl-CoA carboxylase biotin carboxyl carrier protein [Verrucomicrobia bacterium]|nr:acetyl-CoA carboxylase biotin carboxyl carrier protein [Verrucomicrobiota bacterium]
MSSVKNYKPVDLKEIRTLVDLMKKNGIAVFKMEKEGFKITMKTGEAGGPVHYVTSAPASAAPALPPSAPAEAPAAAAAAVADGIEIKSPMVGTFYASPSPENPPFVTVGQEITPDTVVCIIEAMKVMNEIKAEVSGTVVEISAENGKPVQFGQTLFRLK